MDTQFRKGVLEPCVLALLRRRPRYGYELVQEIRKSLDITEGTVYPLLRRLKDEGYVETFLKESSEGPTRKYYTLTPRGKERLASLLGAWDVFSRSVDALLKEARR